MGWAWSHCGFLSYREGTNIFLLYKPLTTCFRYFDQQCKTSHSISAVAKSRRHQDWNFFWECRESNLALVGEKCERCLCAKPPWEAATLKALFFPDRGLLGVLWVNRDDAVQALPAHGGLRELRHHHEEVRRVQDPHRAVHPLQRLLWRKIRSVAIYWLLSGSGWSGQVFFTIEDFLGIKFSLCQQDVFSDANKGSRRTSVMEVICLRRLWLDWHKGVQCWAEVVAQR